MILDFVVAPTDISPGHNAVVQSGIGHLSSVCKDWQAYFEPHTFGQLVIHSPRLSTFQEAIEHNPMRLSYIENILLIIKLAEYGCDSCEKFEDQATVVQ